MRLLKKNKLFYFVIAIFVLFFSCNSHDNCEKKEKILGKNIKYKNVKIEKTYNNCKASDENCTFFIVNYPDIVTGLNIAEKEKVNLMIRNTVLSMLGSNNNENFDTLKLSFFNEFKKYEKISDSKAPWKLKCKGSVIYESPMVLTVKLYLSSYLGGAHDNYQTKLLNFQLETGKLLNMNDIIKNTEFVDFIQYAEFKFRESEQLFEENTLNSYGYNFEENKFRLPENFGFTKTGLLLHYNHNEIAPFAKGYFEILLPFNEVSRFLKSNIVESVYQINN